MLESYDFEKYDKNAQELPKDLNSILNRLTLSYQMENISNLFSGQNDNIKFEYRMPLYNGVKTPPYYISPLFYSFLNNGLRKDSITKNKNIYIIVYMLEGSGILKYNNNVYALSPNEGFLIPYNQPFHFTSTNSTINFFNFHFSGENMKNIYQEFLNEDIVVFRNMDSARFNILMSAILASDCATSSHRNFHCNIAIERLLEGILYQEIKKDKIKKPQSITFAQKYINQNYTQKITLDDISKQCDVSKYHLSREFKKYIGISPNEYIIDVRLYNAQFLLLTTDNTISQIASMVGFRNESNFRRQFRNKYGKTASEFRAQLDFSQQDIFF